MQPCFSDSAYLVPNGLVSRAIEMVGPVEDSGCVSSCCEIVRTIAIDGKIYCEEGLGGLSAAQGGGTLRRLAVQGVVLTDCIKRIPSLRRPAFFVGGDTQPAESTHASHNDTRPNCFAC